jgi:hypothetical protein
MNQGESENESSWSAGLCDCIQELIDLQVPFGLEERYVAFVVRPVGRPVGRAEVSAEEKKRFMSEPRSWRALTE